MFIYKYIYIQIYVLHIYDHDLLIYLSYFSIRIYSMQGWTATTRHGVTRKRNTKRIRHTGSQFRKNLQLKDVLNII